MASFKISGTFRTGTPKPASCIREYSYTKAVLKGNGEGSCAEYAGNVVGKHHQKAREHELDQFEWLHKSTAAPASLDW